MNFPFKVLGLGRMFGLLTENINYLMTERCPAVTVTEESIRVGRSHLRRLVSAELQSDRKYFLTKQASRLLEFVATSINNHEPGLTTMSYKKSPFSLKKISGLVKGFLRGWGCLDWPQPLIMRRFSNYYIRLVFWTFAQKLKVKKTKTQAQKTQNSRIFCPKLKLLVNFSEIWEDFYHM